jgi:hypothetical protein
VIAIISYLIIIPALLFWLELSRGSLRLFVQIATIAAAMIGIVGVYSSIFTESPDRFMPYRNLVSILVISVLLALAVVIAVPALAKQIRGPAQPGFLNRHTGPGSCDPLRLSQGLFPSP